MTSPPAGNSVPEGRLKVAGGQPSFAPLGRAARTPGARWRFRSRNFGAATLIIGLLAIAVSTACAESLTLLPAKFTLDGPAAEQRLVLELVAPQPK